MPLPSNYLKTKVDLIWGGVERGRMLVCFSNIKEIDTYIISLYICIGGMLAQIFKIF